jgi:hypothetical protein
MLKIIKDSKHNPYVITAIVSLVLSYLAVSTDNLLNHDAIFFMNAAKIYLRNDLKELIEYFPWPFYSWCVAILHKVLWFQHVEQTAHLFNAVVIAAICVLFIKVYAEITNNEGSLWVAAILVLTLVGINKYRADVMKDFGYWLSFLAGFYCLLRYYKRPRWLTALGWQLFTIAAFLFRIEGIVIMLLGPLAIFLKSVPVKEKVTQIIPLYGLYIVGLIVALVSLLFVDSQYANIQLGRLPMLLDYLNISGMLDSYDSAVKKLGEIFWYEGSKSKYYGLLVVIYAFTLLTYVTARIVGCLSFPYFVVLIFGAFKKHIVLNDSNKIVLYFIAFLFLFFYVYMIKGPVLSSRYTTSLVFMVLLLLGQIVERMLPVVNSSKHRKKIAAALFIYLFISTVDAVITTQGDSKTYILNAGYWVKDNTIHTTPVYSNYYKALYYTDREFSLQKRANLDGLIRKIRSGKIPSGAVVIFHIHSEKREMYMPRINEMEAAKKIELLERFSNDENDGLDIYKIK